jgi:uncharacterized membrane protein
MRIVYLCAVLLCIERAAFGQGPIFEAVELPGNPVAINDNNEVLGNSSQDAKPAAFLWKDGVTTVLPPLGDGTYPRAFNNRGEIVGLVHYNDESRAWHRTAAGEDQLLPGSSADSINDRGDILGFGPSGGFLISADPPLTNAAACARPKHINNARLIVGENCQGAALWREFTNQFELLLPDPSPDVQSGAVPNDISESGLIVGSYNLYSYNAQAGYWNGQTWRELAAPMNQDAIATAANSAGVIVGYQRFEPDDNGAVLWTTNGIGYNLSTLTKLPAGTHLFYAYDINENGYIVAVRNNDEGFAFRGVLLKPIGSITSLPELEVVEPAQHIQHESNVVASVRFTRNSAPLAKVIYRLLARSRYEGFSTSGPNVSYTTWMNRTFEATEEPFAVVMTNLPPRQYFVSVEVVTETGVSIYLPARAFLVTGPTHIDLIRTRFDGTVDAGFEGAPGRLYTIEASVNMSAWTSIGLPPMRGGNFTLPAAEGQRRFYRLKVSAEDPEAFGMGYRVPTSLTLAYEGVLNLLPAGAASPIRFSYYWGQFEAQWPDRGWNFAGTYEYLSREPIPEVAFKSADFNGTISLLVPIDRSNPAESQFRGHFLIGSTPQLLTGTYEIRVP